jgi:hypothetical protein
MTQAFGRDWPTQRTPPSMLDDWKRKRKAAIEKGQEEHPLLAYADFTDYIKNHRATG